MSDVPLVGGDMNDVVRVGDICDSYGLDASQRAGLLDSLIGHRRRRIEDGAFRGTAPVEISRANLRWTEKHAPELATFLA